MKYEKVNKQITILTPHKIIKFSNLVSWKDRFFNYIKNDKYNNGSEGNSGNGNYRMFQNNVSQCWLIKIFIFSA